MERADALVHRPRHPARAPDACAPTTPTSSPTTRRATSDIEYLFPMGWSELEGDRQPRRLRPHPARRVLGREARVLRPAERRALRPARDRARRRRRPRDARVHRRRLRHRGGRGPHSAPCCACTRGSPRSRSRCCRWSRATGCRSARARSSTRCATGSRPSTTRAARSASATGARTRSAPRGGSPSTARRSRTAPSPCATATRSSRRGSPPTSLGDLLVEKLAGTWTSPKLD